MCTGPLITLWILNKYFGKLYDANTDSDTGICYLGNGCYQGAFELSLVLCGMTFVVTLLLIYIQKAITFCFQNNVTFHINNDI